MDFFVINILWNVIINMIFSKLGLFVATRYGIVSICHLNGKYVQGKINAYIIKPARITFGIQMNLIPHMICSRTFIVQRMKAVGICISCGSGSYGGMIMSEGSIENQLCDHKKKGYMSNSN